MNTYIIILNQIVIRFNSNPIGPTMRNGSTTLTKSAAAINRSVVCDVIVKNFSVTYINTNIDSITNILNIKIFISIL